MWDQFRAHQARKRDLKEIEALTERDLDDLGLNRAQMLALAWLPQDAPDRMAQMAAHYGLDRTALQDDRATFLNLLGTCGTCHDRAACADLLARSGPLSRAETGFCPNAGQFAAMAESGPATPG